eukprot:CAMPEP_0116026688 /NCGR_PEP_ID=MMETSP0321-20121206/14048_1 /TAXON_ID=163516 /ORGANISM="Leptocylindrus danicus var. danicus, Strain B650" /LENGTH=394 /DNA_ID=CAMNT_0003499631 /DNA_START=29 /DNA_END=1213 /DNA_ORIENTATION=-
MTYYLKSGKKFKVTSKEEMDLHETLPVGTYAILLDSCSGQYYLESIGDFEINHKIYGKAIRRSDRILQTFQSRSSSTGVLLSGEKGSGKTLLAKKICIDAAAKGISTLVVNEAWTGEAFNSFIQMIGQPTLVLFDEFEKVYDSDDQEQLLTLLDGVYPSQKLFLLTCNDRDRIDSNFLNRPGRIFYALKFEGLDADFIREYCEDNLDAKEYIPQICSIATLFAHFNFDMLKAMVEEMNRYKESPSEVMEMLNVDPEYGVDSDFVIKFYKDGKRVKKELVNYDEEFWSGNPMNEDLSFRVKIIKVKDKKDGDDDNNDSDSDDEDYEIIYAKFTKTDMKHIDADRGEYVFVNAEEERLVLKREEKPKMMNYNLLSNPRFVSLPVPPVEEEVKKIEE